MTIRIIAGTIRQGQGNASINYANMISAVAQRFPAVANCGQFGTINVRLDERLEKGHADFWTPRTVWRRPASVGAPLLVDERQEEFGFIQAKFEYPLNDRLSGVWIILPSGHQATYADPFFVELIAAELIGGCRVEYGSRCAIHLSHIPAKERPSSFGDNYAQYHRGQSLW